MFGKYDWLFYVALAGLSWGTYVPLIFFGGSELGGNVPGPKAAPSRVMAILCVGIAYFLIAVLFPLVYLYVFTAPENRPAANPTGLTFAGLAGVAGAVGAICVIFATKSAVLASKGSDINFKLYIAPLIFGLAPVINTLISVIWHPKEGNPFHFDVVLPGWKLWVGILLVGAGAALVLFSKEETESSKAAAPRPAPSVAEPGGSPALEKKT
jgi:tellurite resistance protein TehA-like permease